MYAVTVGGDEAGVLCFCFLRRQQRAHLHDFVSYLCEYVSVCVRVPSGRILDAVMLLMIAAAAAKAAAFTAHARS